MVNAGTRRRLPVEGSRRLWWGLALLVFVAAVAGGVSALWLGRSPGHSPVAAPPESAPESIIAGSRGVVLFFPDDDGIGMVTEELLLPSRDQLDEDVLSVMTVLQRGPRAARTAAALPAGARPLGVFLDRAAGHAVVDWSRELITGQPGGSAAELATLTSILRTLTWNFPELATCTLLVEGAPVSTLAGHLDADRPFILKRWR